jgi:GNAT superfamily N-acetyltransferase
MDANGTTIDLLLHPDEQGLAGINRVVEAAVMTWDLSERVKRLALPSYRYSDIDGQVLEFVVARDRRSRILGVASWEPAKENDSPPGKQALLIHGLFVDSACHRQGIGRALVDALLAQTAAAGNDGLLVKAQRDALGFFSACGFLPLPVHDKSRQYAHRLWKPVR